MDTLITSTSEIQMWDNAKYALITFYNYIEAWVIYVKKLYGSNDDGINSFINKLKSLPKFKRIQGGASIDEDFINSYYRGHLTLQAMNDLPIEEYPELAISANLWLPVQSYYAIHGVGSALLIASTNNPPKTHRAFCACFSDIAQKYFPYPLCGQCIGGPETKDFSFPGLNTNAAKVIKQNNLAAPKFIDSDDFIGKSLSSTRRKILDELFAKKRSEKVKPPRKRRNLPLEEKHTSCQGEHATSICDFIYRMRVRSNYDNPDMYLFATESADKAVSHYQNLRYLTKTIIAGLDILIEKKVKPTVLAKLKSRFEH